MGQCKVHSLFRGLGNRHQGQAQLIGTETKAGRRILHGRGIGLEEEVLVQVQELILNCQSALIITGERLVLQLGAEARGNVRGDGNATVATMGIEAKRGHVFTRKENEILAQLGALEARTAHIGRRILDANDVGMGIAKAGNGIDRQIDNGAAGNAIENDGNADGLGNRGKMLEQPFLVGLVVIGHDRQNRVGAGLLGVAGKIDCFSGRIGASAGQNGHALVGDFNADFNHTAMFFVADRGAFARRADGNKPVRALGDLPIDKTCEGFLIHCPVAHGGDERRNRTSQHFVGDPQLPGAGRDSLCLLPFWAFGDAHHTFKFGEPQGDAVGEYERGGAKVHDQAPRNCLRQAPPPVQKWGSEFPGDVMFGKRRMVPADHKPFSGLPVEMIALRNADIRAAVHISAPLVAGATPLVCLAGLQRNMSDFSTLLQAISHSTISRGPVILIDLPGRGRADDRKNEIDYNTIADARDVADILAALGVDRAVMLGQGHGGQVTLALGAEHPLLLAGVILLDAGPMVDSRGIFRLRNNLAHLAGLKGSRSVMAGFRRMLAGDYPELPIETLDALAQRSHFIDKKGRAHPLFDERLLAPLASINFDDVLEAQWPLYDALRGVPLMILRTQLTDQLRRETYEEMVRRRPDAKAFTIAGQGSPALFDQHEEVDAILRFVTKAAAGKLSRAA